MKIAQGRHHGTAPEASGRVRGALTDGAPRVFEAPIDPRRGDNPATGQEICPGFSLHHDGQVSELAWRQTPEYGLLITTDQFSGSYLSLAVALDSDAVARFAPGLGVRARIMADASRPLVMFLRLNLETEVGTDVLHEAMIIEDGEREAVFDLDAAQGSSGRMRSAWLDVIFADPRMVEIRIGGLEVDLVPQ